MLFLWHQTEIPLLCATRSQLEPEGYHSFLRDLAVLDVPESAIESGLSKSILLGTENIDLRILLVRLEYQLFQLDFYGHL